jgi:hypothetical protein
MMQPHHQLKECPRCGKTFTCTGNLYCWCMEVSIPNNVKDYIAAKYDGCLCKVCIEEVKKKDGLQ